MSEDKKPFRVGKPYVKQALDPMTGLSYRTDGREWFDRAKPICLWVSRRLGGRQVFGHGYWKKPESIKAWSVLPWIVSTNPDCPGCGLPYHYGQTCAALTEGGSAS